MHAELPILSFLCVALLAGIVPAYWASRSIPMLSLITWLLLCNIIQGINSIVWAKDAAIRIPAWCDIVTKILIGAWIGLPAACLCLCRHLMNCSMQVETKGRRRFLAFDLVLCAIVPILYMTMHIIVQDRRFELAHEYGCTPAIFMSIPAVFLIWIPPFTTCTAALVFAALALYNFSRALSLTSSRNPSGFGVLTLTRPIMTAFIIVSIILSSTAFSLHARIVSTGGIQHWTSWAAVHVQLSTVHVISSTAELDLLRIAVTWWAIPVCSFVLVSTSVVGFVYGAREEVLRGYRRFSRWFNAPVLQARPAGSFSGPALKVRDHMILTSPTTPMPVLLLGSDCSDTMRSCSSTASVKARPAPLSITIPGRDAVSPPTSSASDNSDEVFARSTLKYVGSPTGRQALGLLPLPPCLHRPTKPASLPIGPSASTLSSPPPAAHRPAESTDAPSRSILTGPWPRPPSAIPTVPITISPPTPRPSTSSADMPRRASISSLSTSLASSTISTASYVPEPVRVRALKDSPTLPHFPPFLDAGVPVQATPPVPKHTRRKGSRDRLVTRNLSLSSRSRERAEVCENGLGPQIYMTVVKETA